jgi:hypothetical protein
MKDYSKGKIYKIVDESNEDVYIGSTIQSLDERFNGHHIFTDYDKNKCDCKISLIEDYPCNSKQELEQREKYFIQTNDCINKMKYRMREEGDFIIMINVFKPTF